MSEIGVELRVHVTAALAFCTFHGFPEIVPVFFVQACVSGQECTCTLADFLADVRVDPSFLIGE